MSARERARGERERRGGRLAPCLVGVREKVPLGRARRVEQHEVELAVAPLAAPLATGVIANPPRRLRERLVDRRTRRRARVAAAASSVPFDCGRHRADRPGRRITPGHTAKRMRQPSCELADADYFTYNLCCKMQNERKP